MSPATLAKEAILRALGGTPPDSLPWEAPLEGLFLVVADPAGNVRAALGTSRAEEDSGPLLARLAREAVAGDPRFPPLEPGDIGTVRLWLLGPGRSISGPGDLRPGDALRVTLGRFSGVFLPENYMGETWEALSYLKQACRRAGLDALAFEKEGASVRAFPTTLFES